MAERDGTFEIGQAVGVASDRNWMHDPEFDQQSMEEFEKRLTRARPASRAGYLRVKGATLLELGDRRATAVAVGLLTRVVEDYDHFLEIPWAHELLGEAYRELGDLQQAEHHLRMCMQTRDDRGNGTTKVTELSLAEVLLAQGRQDEAGEMLARQDVGMLLWNAHLFRYAVACARYEQAVGGDPAPWASEALRLAENRTPQLPRHPQVGLVEADPETLVAMRAIATGVP